MSIVIDENANLTQVRDVWRKFRENENFNRYESSPGKIYWRNVVKLSSRTNDYEFLKEFGRTRKEIVDKLVSISFKMAAESQNCLSCVTCAARSVGSTDPTSDYDITITGATSYLIIEQFYVIFRQLFEAEPGDVFDTNVYGGPTEFTIWNAERFKTVPDDNLYKKVYRKLQTDNMLTPLRRFTVDEGFLTTLQPKDNEKPTEFCTNTREKDCVWNPTKLCTLERCWAFLAFFRFFHNDYKEFAFEQFEKFAPRAQHDLLNYMSLRKVISADVAAYQKLMLNETCNVRSEPTMLKMCYETNYYLTLVGRANAAEKRLYRAIVEGRKNNEQMVAMRNNLKNAIAHSNMYASEIYVTNGAVLHIVVVTQMKLNLPGLLRADDLFASFLENCGFAFHVFEDTKPLDRFVDGPFCIAALVNGSKYLGRIFDALNRFKPNPQLEVALEEINTVRSEFRGKVESADVDKVTAAFWSIVENSGILKERSHRCLRNQFLRHFLKWVAEKTQEFYAK